MYVDWVSYYDAAKKCHDLADDLRAADKPLHTAVKDVGAGMAGDAPGCVEWAKSYDGVAQRALQACTNLSDALTNFGNVLYASGYNYGTSNNSDPAPPRPNVTAMAEYKVTVPSATTGTSGIGVRKDGDGQFFDDLLSDITSEFKKLPNANVDALAKVSQAWSTFASSAALSGAKARIATISSMFDDMDQIKNRELIQQHFNTIGTSADAIVLAAQKIAAPVGEFNTGIHNASSQIDMEMTDLKIEAGFTIGLAAVGSIFSLGGSAVAGVARVGVLVVSAMTKIRKVLNSADLLKILGFAGAFGGAVAAITAFEKVPDTEKIALALAEIIAMKVLVDEAPPLKFEPSPKHGKEQRGDAAPEPTHPQETLDKSVQVKDTSSRRVGYDPETGEFAVFDETHNGTGIYHGHQRAWDGLTQDMQNALVKAGVVNRKGKPL
ncbi:hypothetical protein [Nocardia salmonicida]|uniref:hypothetical protein n=1 Tax=Nocardia salmonicida TaxID=53431 RepID=UPI00379C6077